MDQSLEAGKFIEIDLVGMDRPYLEQKDDLYRIKAECAEKTGIPLKNMGHMFGSMNLINFYLEQEADLGKINEGLDEFQKAHPKFKIKLCEFPIFPG